ncbi:unnamed protein product [Larinioides sclopetarius]|uniref:Uncharacterized protein n=1 Tax=Larinioides sclopetarius TaxID=280406 RepID=A0AAV1ZPZ3_9ARAC
MKMTYTMDSLGRCSAGTAFCFTLGLFIGARMFFTGLFNVEC